MAEPRIGGSPGDRPNASLGAFTSEIADLKAQVAELEQAVRDWRDTADTLRDEQLGVEELVRMMTKKVEEIEQTHSIYKTGVEALVIAQEKRVRNLTVGLRTIIADFQDDMGSFHRDRILRHIKSRLASQTAIPQHVHSSGYINTYPDCKYPQTAAEPECAHRYSESATGRCFQCGKPVVAE